jgi:hypothetical protein
MCLQRRVILWKILFPFLTFLSPTILNKHMLWYTSTADLMFLITSHEANSDSLHKTGKFLDPMWHMLTVSGDVPPEWSLFFTAFMCMWGPLSKVGYEREGSLTPPRPIENHGNVSSVFVARIRPPSLYVAGRVTHEKVECVRNVMAQAQKTYFVFRRNVRVQLNWRGLQFSRLLSAEVCPSAVVMLDTTCSEVVWRVLVTHSIRKSPLHFPSRTSPCAITF